ncbi:unnamed protein product [Photorhabdus laumondii subsp. laumondii TTO1]|uniref:Photorhabdus luminescens subsp. laumondii TTO1 complete genome segment 9/17 n=1 Tax=Photorhabdus laumondii subsp. laumondii (strain DSM 15139 / CIP 105565 / TT01) TaxID=243265 RepID=Q7N4A6_PHOLL|nr:inclusion body family protein [Photorhabdus laumondii]CAE14817.1 unnamed protein product [Photorhabdus laumondii subsp. laumondii TTO1]
MSTIDIFLLLDVDKIKKERKYSKKKNEPASLDKDHIHILLRNDDTFIEGNKETLTFSKSKGEILNWVTISLAGPESHYSVVMCGFQKHGPKEPMKNVYAHRYDNKRPTLNKSTSDSSSDKEICPAEFTPTLIPEYQWVWTLHETENTDYIIMFALYDKEQLMSYYKFSLFITTTD